MATMRRGAGAEEGSSVLFSLGELMKIEEQRVGEERAREREAARAAEASRKEQAERTAREEAARVAEEEARRLAAERGAREEAARLEALRAATVERARVEAEEGARLAAAAAAQEHERHILAIRQDEAKRRLSRWLGVVAAAGALAVIGGAALYFGHLRPEAERRERLAAVELGEARDALDRAKRELAEREAVVERLAAERDAATDARKRAELDAKIQAEEKKIRELGGRTGGPRPPVPPPQAPKKCGNPDDPLNDCL